MFLAFCHNSCFSCIYFQVELIELLEQNEDGADLTGTSNVNWLNAMENGKVMGSAGGSSGGYAEYIVRKFVEEQQKPLQINKIMKSATNFDTSNCDSVCTS